MQSFLKSKQCMFMVIKTWKTFWFFNKICVTFSSTQYSKSLIFSLRGQAGQKKSVFVKAEHG